MSDNMKKIQALENKYGLILFGMGLTQLMDVGMNNLGDDALEDNLNQVTAQDEAERASGIHPVMTLDFKCEIIRCATELAKFTPFTLFAYIKNHMHIAKGE